MADHIATPAFGFADNRHPFGKGVRPHIAVSKAGGVVTAFSEHDNKMKYAVGALADLTVAMEAVQNLSQPNGNSDGYAPAIAISSDDVVVELHVNDKDKTGLWYSSGPLRQTGGKWIIEWSATKEFQNSKDGKPNKGNQTALSNVTPGNDFIALYRDEDGVVSWTLGHIAADGVSWTSERHKIQVGSNQIKGENPAIAINGTMVVELHQRGKKIYAVIGTLDIAAKSITWHREIEYDSGTFPSLYLADDNTIYEFHQGNSQKLWQRVGRISGSGASVTITWLNWLGQKNQYSYEYDINYMPLVVRHGDKAVQVCAASASTSSNSDLYCSASFIIDRARWMGGNLPVERRMTVSDIAMPASHDAGMYDGAISKVARTQNLTILGQCLTGSRYFDIRPTHYLGGFYCYHGESIFRGASIDSVLDDIATFLKPETEGGWDSKELIILKFSHYGGGIEPLPTNKHFMELLSKIQTKLGTWLCPPPAPSGRIAQSSVASLIADKGCVLVVCDGFKSGYASGGTPVRPGIYAYRDWESPDPKNGDLTVFDIYSDTTNLDQMIGATDAASKHGGPSIPNLPNGQLPKFQGPGVPGVTPAYTGFSGTCSNDASVPCDMFLLSWTLTPVTDVWDTCQPANASLVDRITPKHFNDQNRVINMIYVDYVSYSRATDVAFLRNRFIS